MRGGQGKLQFTSVAAPRQEVVAIVGVDKGTGRARPPVRSTIRSQTVRCSFLQEVRDLQDRRIITPTALHSIGRG
jgi:hypothetical protein